MSAILLESESASDLKLLLTLAKKLGVKSRKLSSSQWDDHLLASEIESGMETEDVSREEVMKALLQR